MAYRVKAYTLREESTESGTRYFISFKDGQGKDNHNRNHYNSSNYNNGKTACSRFDIQCAFCRCWTG